MTPTPILDRAMFRVWLVEHINDEVGLARHCSDCPIGAYLKEIRRLEDDEIDVDSYLIQIRDNYVETPQWACDFIFGVDETTSDREPFALITGHRALAILDAIGDE